MKQETKKFRQEHVMDRKVKKTKKGETEEWKWNGMEGGSEIEDK